MTFSHTLIFRKGTDTIDKHAFEMTSFAIQANNVIIWALFFVYAHPQLYFRQALYRWNKFSLQAYAFHGQHPFAQTHVLEASQVTPG